MQQHPPPTTVGQLMDKASLSSSDVVDTEKNANFAGASEAIDHAAEKKLVWKLDLYMMPLLFYLYMLCFLDRTNIGNARVAGLERSIGLTGYQYNIGLSVFYIFYAGIEVPSNMVLRWIGAQKWIPTIIVAFGLVTTCTAFIKNFADFMLVRVFLGITEGGLMPAYLLVLSRFYSRREVVFRTALFASSATIAGMFGGLLAYGFLQVDLPFLEDRWRNIFFLEGIITLGSGLLAFFAISNAPGTAKFLTPEERIIAERRIRRENIGTKVLIEAAKKEIFWRAFRNPNTLLCALGFGLSSLSLQGLALFIPTIIRGIDPTFTTVEIQLKTVPVYAVAFVIAISGSLLCMRYDRRAYTIILVNIFAVVGFAMFLGTETRQTNVRYGALFLCAMGIYTPGPIWLSWGIGNAGLDQERAVAAGLLVGLGTMGSVVASWSFLPTDAPRYKIGNSLNLSVVLASQALAVFLMFYNRRENTKRAQGRSNHLVEGKTEEEIATLGHKHPEFIYKW